MGVIVVTTRAFLGPYAVSPSGASTTRPPVAEDQVGLVDDLLAAVYAQDGWAVGLRQTGKYTSRILTEHWDGVPGRTSRVRARTSTTSSSAWTRWRREMPGRWACTTIERLNSRCDCTGTESIGPLGEPQATRLREHE